MGSRAQTFVLCILVYVVLSSFLGHVDDMLMYVGCDDVIMSVGCDVY